MDESKIQDIETVKYLLGLLDLNTSSLNIISVIIIILFAARLIFAILINRKILYFCRDIQVSLRSDLMQTYQRMPYEEFIDNDSSDAIANTTILTMNFTNNVLYTTLKAFAEIVLALFLFIFLISINGLLVLILSMGLGFLIFAYNNFFKSKMVMYGQKINLANANLVQAVTQSLKGIKEVRVLGKEDFFFKRYISNAKIYGHLHANAVLISTGSRYFIEFAIMGFFVLCISASSFLITGDSLDVFSTLGMFAFAAIRLLPGVNVLSSAILNLRVQKNTVDRLHETVERLDDTIDARIDVFKNNENINETKIISFESIKLKNIDYKYPKSENNVLRGINLEVHKGESIGIIGPSGSGKTSLVDLMLGLLEPKSGEMTLNDKPFMEFQKDWKKMIAYIPQESLMINDSLSSNIQLDDINISNYAIDKLERSLSQAKLTEVVQSLPNGVSTNIGESGIRLSGGQRQRVALARSIFHDRDILVFDEATSALDLDTEAAVVNEIKKMKGLKTMIIIAHRIDTLKFCDRIYKLENGRIDSVGPPDKILEIKKT